MFRKKKNAPYFKKYEALRREAEAKKAVSFLKDMSAFVGADFTAEEVFEKAGKVSDKFEAGKEVSCVPPPIDWSKLTLSENADLDEMQALLKTIEDIAKQPEKKSFPKQSEETAKKITVTAIDATMGMAAVARDAAGRELGIGFAGLQDALKRTINAAAAVIQSSVACAKAQKKTDFNYWFKRELINHHIWTEKIKKFQQIRKDENLSEEFSGEQLNEWEQKIFGKAMYQEAQAYSLKKYREFLQEALQAEEILKLDSNPEKQQQQIINLIIQLECHHLRRKILQSEKDVTARLAVQVKDSLIDKTKATKIIAKFVVGQKEHLQKVLKGEIECTPTHRQLNKEIISSVEKKVAQEQTNLKARLYLLISATLILSAAIILATCFLTAVIPPVGLAIGFAIGSVAAFGIAKYLKPDITQDVSSGFKNAAHKISKEYGFWKTKSALKKEYTITAKQEVEEVSKGASKEVAKEVSKEEASIKDKTPRKGS